MAEWFEGHPGWKWWVAAASAVMFVGSLVVIPILVARIPAEYFLRPRGQGRFARMHPVTRALLVFVKNVAGLLFLLAGLAMLITPGQGILSILIAITLLDLPGKRRLELAIIRRKNVLNAINWIREKAHRPPLKVPPLNAESADSGHAPIQPVGPSDES